MSEESTNGSAEPSAGSQVEHPAVTHDERVMAALAHGSALLGLFTNGVGGIGAALIIWLTQREKSAYVAYQALQALVYQVVTMLITMVAWGCWMGLWMAMTLPPLIANPGAYQNAPPAGMWVGLTMIACPLAVMALTVLYGLVGAAQNLRGQDFRYAVIGNWLRKSE